MHYNSFPCLFNEWDLWANVERKSPTSRIPITNNPKNPVKINSSAKKHSKQNNSLRLRNHSGRTQKFTHVTT